MRPVAYHSRRFKPAEENYSATDREMLAIVDSLRHYRHYIAGLPLTVRTDHAPLQYLFSQQHLSGRQARWLETLAEFQPGLSIQYVPGPSNIPADALTRRPDYMALSTLLPSSAGRGELQAA